MAVRCVGKWRQILGLVDLDKGGTLLLVERFGVFNLKRLVQSGHHSVPNVADVSNGDMARTKEVIGRRLTDTLKSRDGLRLLCVRK